MEAKEYIRIMKVTKKTILLNAIVWAAALIIGSYFMRGHEHWTFMFVGFIGGFTIVNSYLERKRKGHNPSKPHC